MKFLTELDVLDLSDCKEDRYILQSPLVFDADFATITIPAGFVTDYATVPRMPIIYLAYGNRAHKSATLHDYLYRIGASPDLTRDRCDRLFKQSMLASGHARWIASGMWLGVRSLGWVFYKKRIL